MLTQIARDSTGYEVIEQYKRECSHYFSQAKLNRYMSYEEALRIGTELVRSHVPAAPQATAALRALTTRLNIHYKPYSDAAELEILVAPTATVVNTAMSAASGTASALQAIGNAPQQGEGETVQQFAARQQQYYCSSTTLHVQQHKLQ